MPIGTSMFDNYLKHHKENTNLYIIDAHSHFGEDGYWPNVGDYAKYIETCEKLLINEVFAMPVPCPVIIKDDGTKILLSNHKMSGNNLEHYRVEKNNGKRIEIPHLLNSNPYKEANDKLYEMTKNNDSTIKMNYVPLIHPYYYSNADFEEHRNRGAKMLKIHGIACGVIPEKIDDKFFELLEEIQIPVIIHTDYSKDENILSYNSAINWISRFENYDIKVYITHAARFNDYVTDMINSDDRYIVGIGPDQLLSYPGQNEKSPSDYLECCLQEFDINKIVFDIDYPWNVQGIDNYEYDWGSIYRLSYKLSIDEKEKIFSENIKRFVRER